MREREREKEKEKGGPGVETTSILFRRQFWRNS